MRILIVSHGFPPFGVAGVERTTEQTAAALRAEGHAVTVLSRRISGAPRLPRLEPALRPGSDVIWISGSGPFAAFPGHQARLEWIFQRILLELIPDVVVLAHVMAHSPRYVSIAHRWGIPVVMELHDFYAACERAHLERPSGDLCDGPQGGGACAIHCFSEQSDASQRWALRTHLYRRALEQADALLAPSAFVADYFRDYSRRAEGIYVIPNGIAFAPAPLPVPARSVTKAPLRLASLGVAVPHKGAHIVLEALRKARLPAVEYTLLGPITQPYVGELRHVAGEIDGLCLRTYGPYDPASLPLLLAETDAVIIPSIVWETFSIVAREAMACGVPVIASRLGALPEAIREGENGLLFAPGAASELAGMLQILDEDRSHLDQLRGGIRETDWISAAERARALEAVLEGVVARGVEDGAGAGDAELATVRTLLSTV